MGNFYQEDNVVWGNQFDSDIAYLESLPPSEHKDRLLDLARAVKALGVRRFHEALKKRGITTPFD